MSNVKVTMATFDSRMNGEPWVRVKYAGVPLDEVPALTLIDYAPSGGTPLLDAVGHMIATLDKAVAEAPDDIHIGAVLDESGSMGSNRKAVIDGYNEFIGSIKGVKPEAGGRVLLVVMTDGEENQSREHTRDSIKQMIDEREAGTWSTIYLGANQDAWSGAGAAGMPQKAGAFVNYTSSPVGTASAMRGAALRTSNFLASSDKATYESANAALGDVIPEAEPGYSNVGGLATAPSTGTSYSVTATTTLSAFLKGEKPEDEDEGKVPA